MAEARVVKHDGVAVVTGGVGALDLLRSASDFCCEKWPEGKAHDTWEGVTISQGKVVELHFVGTYAQRCRLPFLPAEIGGLVALKVLELSWMRRLSELRRKPARQLVLRERLDVDPSVLPDNHRVLGTHL